MAFITILNNLRMRFLVQNIIKESVDGRIRVPCYSIHNKYRLSVTSVNKITKALELNKKDKKAGEE